MVSNISTLNGFAYQHQHLVCSRSRGDQLSAINQKIKQCAGIAELISSLDTATLQVLVSPATDVERQSECILNKDKDNIVVVIDVLV